jgi:hypothetical protein
MIMKRLEQVRSFCDRDSQSEEHGSFTKAIGLKVYARHAPEVTNPRRREMSPEEGMELRRVLARPLRRAQRSVSIPISLAVGPLAHVTCFARPGLSAKLSGST